jgi:hypothetical protein
MLHKVGRFIFIMLGMSLIFQTQLLYSKAVEFKTIDVIELNRYYEDRIAYQQFEKQEDQFHLDNEDTSIAVLMIIKDKKIYLFKDGYDDEKQVRNKMILYSNSRQLNPVLWENRITGTPNYLLVTDRKIELQKSVSKEWITNNYKDFYIRIRDEFLKKHVAIFYSLLIDRMNTDMKVTRRELYKRANETGPAKYATSVVAITKDGGTVYYAEDSDGDGITETFTVNTSDGFSWGYKVGPNVVNIINNTQKDIEKMIGKIASYAYYGSPEEEQIIKKTFPTQDKISAMINDLYRIDPDTNKILKDNKINLEESIERASKTEGRETKQSK